MSCISSKHQILFILVATLLALVSRSQRLLSVKAYARHGLRTAARSLSPKNQRNTFVPNSGLLQPIGLLQSYVLGQQMKELYINDLEFIGSVYNRSEVQFRTTQFERTILSSESLQLGVYSKWEGPSVKSSIADKYGMPEFQTEYEDVNEIGHRNRHSGQSHLKKHNQGFEPALTDKFQPISNKMLYPSDDILFGNLYYDMCPYVLNFTLENQNSKELDMLAAEQKPTIESFAKYLGIPVENVTLYTIDHYYESYISSNNVVEDPEERFGKELWRNMSYIRLMDTQIVFLRTTEQKKVQFTPLGKEILEEFQRAIEGKDPIKMYIYNVHSLHQLLMLNVLNLTSWPCVQQKKNHVWADKNNTCIDKYPPCVSSIMLELWEGSGNDTNYFVKIRYNGDYMKWHDAGEEITF